MRHKTSTPISITCDVDEHGLCAPQKYVDCQCTCHTLLVLTPRTQRTLDSLVCALAFEVWRNDKVRNLSFSRIYTLVQKSLKKNLDDCTHADVAIAVKFIYTEAQREVVWRTNEWSQRETMERWQKAWEEWQSAIQ